MKRIDGHQQLTPLQASEWFLATGAYSMGKGTHPTDTKYLGVASNDSS